MLIPPLDGTIRVPSANGADLGGSGYGGIDLGQLHEDLKALEAQVRELNVNRAKFLAESRPSRTVGGAGLSGVVGAALRVRRRDDAGWAALAGFRAEVPRRHAVRGAGLPGGGSPR